MMKVNVCVLCARNPIILHSWRVKLIMNISYFSKLPSECRHQTYSIWRVRFRVIRPIYVYTHIYTCTHTVSIEPVGLLTLDAILLHVTPNNRFDIVFHWIICILRTCIYPCNLPFCQPQLVSIIGSILLLLHNHFILYTAVGYCMPGTHFTNGLRAKNLKLMNQSFWFCEDE